jgi:hypothetical protein
LNTSSPNTTRSFAELYTDPLLPGSASWFRLAP